MRFEPGVLGGAERNASRLEAWTAPLGLLVPQDRAGDLIGDLATEPG